MAWGVLSRGRQRRRGLVRSSPGGPAAASPPSPLCPCTRAQGSPSVTAQSWRGERAVSRLRAHLEPTAARADLRGSPAAPSEGCLRVRRCLPASFLLLSVLWRVGGLGRSRAECARALAHRAERKAQPGSRTALVQDVVGEDREGRDPAWRRLARGRGTRLRPQAALWLARQLGEKWGPRADGGRGRRPGSRCGSQGHPGTGCDCRVDFFSKPSGVLGPWLAALGGQSFPCECV